MTSPVAYWLVQFIVAVVVLWFLLLFLFALVAHREMRRH